MQQDDSALNTYILGHTDTEKVRLIEQDRHFNQAMGGLLAEQAEADLSTVHRVLDVACGPGGWALDLAQQYPDIQVVGVDIDEGMIEYANTMARAPTVLSTWSTPAFWSASLPKSSGLR